MEPRSSLDEEIDDFIKFKRKINELIWKKNNSNKAF